MRLGTTLQQSQGVLEAALQNPGSRYLIALATAGEVLTRLEQLLLELDRRGLAHFAFPGRIELGNGSHIVIHAATNSHDLMGRVFNGAEVGAGVKQHVIGAIKAAVLRGEGGLR